MIKKRFLALLLCLVLFNSFTLVAFADNRDLIVYYAVGSSSAYRYHARSSCPSLTRSTVGEITLEEAAALNAENSWTGILVSETIRMILM